MCFKRNSRINYDIFVCLYEWAPMKRKENFNLLNMQFPFERYFIMKEKFDYTYII